MDGVTTRYVYDEQGRLIGEYQADGTLIQETVWLDDLPIATLRPAGNGTPTPVAVYYVHADHLGSPRAITRSADDAIVWRWDNDEPFGANAANENPSGLGTFRYDLRFPGQQYDSETGTHYNYFRDYDPITGRYLQSDPIGFDGGANAYAYVGGAPLAKSDPFGLRDAPPGGSGFAGCYLYRQTGPIAIRFFVGLPIVEYVCVWKCKDACEDRWFFIYGIRAFWNPPYKCPERYIPQSTDTIGPAT